MAVIASQRVTLAELNDVFLDGEGADALERAEELARVLVSSARALGRRAHDPAADVAGIIASLGAESGAAQADHLSAAALVARRLARAA